MTCGLIIVSIIAVFTILCIHYSDCKLNHICHFCQSVKKTRCKYCTQVACFKLCPDYQEQVCDKLSKPPYVCNGCDSIRRCPLQKKFYYAKEAQLDYERTLCDSRSGVMISDGELTELDKLISPSTILPLTMQIRSTGLLKPSILTSIKVYFKPR